MSKRHDGKAIIVTGAAGAIGFATAEILAREGARVMLVDIAADRLEQCTETLRAAGHDAIGYVADCADEKTCIVRRLFADTYTAQLLLLDGTTLAEALRDPTTMGSEPVVPGSDREMVPAE